MSAGLFLIYFSSFSGIFPVLAAIYNRKHLDKVLKIVALFFIISACFDLILTVTSKVGIKNNSPFIHLFMIVCALFFGRIYYYAFNSPALKKAAIGLAALSFAVTVWNGIYGDTIMSFPTISFTFLSITLDILSLLYFYQLLNNTEFTHIEKQYMFWFNSGVLFYFAINIFLFMLFNRILKHYTGDVWIIHDYTNIIANLLYSIALLCKPKLKT